MHNISEIRLKRMQMKKILECMSEKQDTMLCIDTENVDGTLVCLDMQKKVSPGVFP